MNRNNISCLRHLENLWGIILLPILYAYGILNNVLIVKNLIARNIGSAYNKWKDKETKSRSDIISVAHNNKKSTKIPYGMKYYNNNISCLRHL